MRHYAKIGRHVTYITATGRRRSATITGIGANDTLSLRVGRRGGVFTNVPRQKFRTETSVWTTVGSGLPIGPTERRFLRDGNGNPILTGSGEEIEV